MRFDDQRFLDELDELDTLHPTRQARQPTRPPTRRRRPAPPTPPTPPALTGKDVQLASLDIPAQQSLLRLSADPKTRAAAAELLGHVKSGKIAAIRCQKAVTAEARARRLGYTAAQALRSGEDAVLLLDPDDLRSGPPIIALRHDLDPRCTNAKGTAPVPGDAAKIDAALLKSLTTFKVWLAGISLGQLGKCALAPLDDPALTVSPTRLRSMTVLTNILPRLICQPGVVPTTPGTPKLVRHRHVSFNCNSSFAFVPDGPAIDLQPRNMNPRFIMPDDSISVHAPLQTKLTDLILNKYSDVLNKATNTTKIPRQEDKLHIAVVDLSGARKLCQPEFAGFGAEFNEAGASTSKILLFYAAHQMWFDLQEMVKAHGITKVGDLETQANKEWARFSCKPHLKWLFKLTNGSGPVKVEMSLALKQMMDDIVHERDSTPNASKLILHLGFEYIASVAWQSGLRHPRRGGIWYGGTYCQGGGLPGSISGSCHKQSDPGAIPCPKNKTRVIWTADPLGIGGVRGTAIAFATYMTLLAQGRLVDKTMSSSIESFLKHGCPVVGTVLSGVRAEKCGATDVSYHTAALVDHGKVRYAIGIMFKTKDGTDKSWLRVRDLAKDVDALLVAANP